MTVAHTDADAPSTGASSTGASSTGASSTGASGRPRPERPVVVSGIQPSGTLHLGNYFGALRQHVALADDDTRRDAAFYFIVNYHALTTVRDADALRRYTYDVALDYLALGFDPHKAHLFVQADVPEVTELAWVLLCLTPVSQLEKGLAYKDKVAQGLSANAGLFTYPVLQAADILVYGGQPGAEGGILVPVGADQKQNIEISRDLALRFNQAFGEVFAVPEALIMDEVAVVPGTDGRKMSKSYGNTIGIFDEGAALKRKVMGIVTDSTPLEAPKDPDADNVFALLRLFAPPGRLAEIAAAYRAGGYGYGHAKKELLALVTDHFAEARERRRVLAERPGYVRDVLAAGAAAARARAAEVLARVREAVGLVTTHA
ncbi:MAG: tryptophan--tRNA ligase, partial [Rubricoccaceae bacterium]